MEGHEYGLIPDGCTCVYNSELKCAVVRISGCTEASCVSLLVAAQAVGISRIWGVRKCEEVLDVIGVLDALGVRVTHERGCYAVEGVGIGGLAEPRHEVSVGRSPLVACVTIGMLAVHPFSAFLFNGGGRHAACNAAEHESDYINTVMDMLAPMGARFARNGAALPALVVGTDECVPAFPGEVISSNSVKSAMLLSCVGVSGRSGIRAASTLSGYTELLLGQLGARISVERTGCNADTIVIDGQQELTAREICVPAPASGALCAVAAAVMVRGLPVLVPGILVDDTVRGVLNVFVRMGAYIALIPNRGLCDAKVRVGVLRGIKIECAELRVISRELPTICAVCACAVGLTTITGLSALEDNARDRLDMAATELAKCGIELNAGCDYIAICGCGDEIAAGCENNDTTISGIAARIAAAVGEHTGHGLVKFVEMLSNFREENQSRDAFVWDTSDEKSS
ncbi:MAG: 3-phosphoshikimate 1-carboxyvinyltransferase [Anaplasma ovis]